VCATAARRSVADADPSDVSLGICAEPQVLLGASPVEDLGARVETECSSCSRTTGESCLPRGLPLSVRPPLNAVSPADDVLAPRLLHELTQVLTSAELSLYNTLRDLVHAKIS